MEHPIAIFSNSYARLPEHFYARLGPTPVAKPRLIVFNQALAEELGLDLGEADADQLAKIFAGNETLPGAEPIAMAYAGHQFGGFSPQLGDGRAILLAEVVDRNGVRRDIQLKGSGPTPFSRRGDGRAALGPVLREYLMSEAMQSLGIPTTRALAAVATGEWVYRDRALPGAVFTRVAVSHIRVGTFQYFAARGDLEAVKKLADYVIERLYPEVKDSPNPYLALLEAFADRQARLVSQWLNIGFIHGVMNTDNMALSGETIDFGPCAFMDAYDPKTVFSSIDHGGRYSYGNQPHAAHWNITRFAEALLPLIDADEKRAIELATEVISSFSARFEDHWFEGLGRKLGLFQSREGDRDLIRGLLSAMQTNGADFTLTFRRLADAVAGGHADADLRALFADPSGFDAWATVWQTRLALEPVAPLERAAAMRAVNPAFIPRNHRVEQALDAAIDRDDFTPFETLLQILSRPYDDQPAFAAYADPAPPSDRVYQTFCGT